MRKNLSQLFYGVLHILLSGLIAAVFCNGVVTDLALLMGGRHVSGKVTAVTTALVSATEGTPNYVIGFTYLIDGKLYEGESYSPSYSYVEGAAVEVEVVRLNSRLARVIDDDLGRSGVLVLSDDPARLVPVPFGDTGCWTKRPESWFVTCRLAVVRDGDLVAVAGRCARLGPSTAQAGHGYRQMEVSDQVSVSATATEPLLISKHDPATAGRS